MPYPIDPIATNLYTLQKPVQTQSFGWIVSIYGVDPTGGTWDASKGDTAGNVLKLYENVPCSIQATKEYDQPGGFGRTPVENQDVLDDIFFHQAQPVQDAQVFVVTAAPPEGQAMVGLWWAFQGNSRIYGWKFATLMMLAKRIKQPKNAYFAAGSP